MGEITSKSRIHSLAVLAEYSRDIGSGHLMESMAVVETASRRGWAVSLWISESAPASLRERTKVPLQFFGDFMQQKEILNVKRQILRSNYDAVVFNFRRMSNAVLANFQADQLSLICIDELGQRFLDCDVVINPSIVEHFHHYSVQNDRPRVFAGPQYLSLADDFCTAHDSERTFADDLKVISVSMGGVDRTGTTLRLLEALCRLEPMIKKNIILGGGFVFEKEVERQKELYKDRNFNFYRNISPVASLFLESDIVFTAGGNTLYELACLGTPAIVLYEDEHEKETGLAFERQGFCRCLGSGREVSTEEVLKAIDGFRLKSQRQAQAVRGRALVDGKGVGRTLQKIEEFLDTFERTGTHR